MNASDPTQPPAYNDRPILVAYILLPLLLMVLLCVGMSLGGRSHAVLLKEGGIVETVSAAGYGLCLLMLLFRGGWTWCVRHHYLVMIVLFLGLRELDFDKRFTTMGIFKSRFFSSVEVPGVEKIIGALVIGLVLYAAGMTLRRHLRPFLRASRALSASTIGIWLIAALLVFSKSIDGLDRKLAGWGVQITARFTGNAAALEEILEMGIPLVMILAVHAGFRSARSRAGITA